MSAVLPGAGAPVEPRPLRRDMPVSDVDSKPDVKVSASERLAGTRSRLRSAMMNIAHPPKRAPVFGSGPSDLVGQLMSRLKALPGAAIVVESVASWWEQHPLHTAGVVAEEASRAFVKPIAQRSPQTLIFGAAAVGALFALTRPWRWLLRPALFVGLMPQLAAHVVKRMPVDVWMKMAASMIGHKTRHGARAAKKAAKPSDPSRPTGPAL